MAVLMNGMHAIDQGHRLGHSCRGRHDSSDGGIQPASIGIGQRVAHARMCLSQAKLKGLEGEGDSNEGWIGLLV